MITASAVIFTMDIRELELSSSFLAWLDVENNGQGGTHDPWSAAMPELQGFESPHKFGLNDDWARESLAPVKEHEINLAEGIGNTVAPSSRFNMGVQAQSQSQPAGSGGGLRRTKSLGAAQHNLSLEQQFHAADGGQTMNPGSMGQLGGGAPVDSQQDQYVRRVQSLGNIDLAHEAAAKQQRNGVTGNSSKPVPRSQTITFQELSQFFHLPINDAAKELGVCATVLKRVCRRNGIQRWPQRKIRSLDRCINNLSAVSAVPELPSEKDRSKLGKEITKLLEKKSQLIQQPHTQVKVKSAVKKCNLKIRQVKAAVEESMKKETNGENIKQEEMEGVQYTGQQDSDPFEMPSYPVDRPLSPHAYYSQHAPPSQFNAPPASEPQRQITDVKVERPRNNSFSVEVDQHAASSAATSQATGTTVPLPPASMLKSSSKDGGLSFLEALDALDRTNDDDVDEATLFMHLTGHPQAQPELALQSNFSTIDEYGTFHMDWLLEG